MQPLRKNLPGYLFLFFLALGSIVAALCQHGLFGDGLMYLTVAFNRFKGYGDFWHQSYSKTAMPFFCEQPPLYFETLYGFYKLFNGHEYAERIFTVFLLFISFVFVFLIWNKLNRCTSDYKALSWLPSALLLAVPVYTWSYSNQVIETMVAPLSLGAFYILLILFEETKAIKTILFFILFILLVFCLFLTKGIQSIFIVAAPLMFSLISKGSKGRIFSLFFLALLSFIGCSLLLYFISDVAKDWVACYLNKRLIATFNHVGATTTYHAEIIIRYFTELIPVLLFFLSVSVYFKTACKYSFKLQFKNLLSDKINLWLFLISLSASLPLAVTLEQRGFYLVPSFPFVVLALSNMYKRYIFYLLGKAFKNHRQRLIFTLILLGFGSVFLFAFQYGTYKNDEDMLKDVATVKNIIPYGETIRIDPSMWNMFALHSYLKKYNDNNLSASDTNTVYFILNKGNAAIVPPKYSKIKTQTFWFDIYKINKKR